MSPTRRRHVGDLILAALVVLGAAGLLIGAAALPPPRFEPLGSAAMPRILAVVLVILAGLVALSALRGLRTDGDADATPRAVPHRGAAVFAALVIYVAALDFARLPFVPVTALFVTATGVAMSAPTLRNALIFAALGTVVALVVFHVFTTFLYIRIG